MSSIVRCKVSGVQYEAMRFTAESKDRVFRWLGGSPFWRCDALGSPETPSLELTRADGTWVRVTPGMWIVKQLKALDVLTDEVFQKEFKIEYEHETIEAAPKPSNEPPMERCDKAPPGWACTRLKGHDGPCAAHNVPESKKRPQTPIYLTLLICSLQILLSQKGEQCVIVEFEDDNGEKFSAEIVEVDASRLATAIVIRCKTPG